jgi:hypothetical protein
MSGDSRAEHPGFVRRRRPHALLGRQGASGPAQHQARARPCPCPSPPPHARHTGTTSTPRASGYPCSTGATTIARSTPMPPSDNQNPRCGLGAAENLASMPSRRPAKPLSSRVRCQRPCGSRRAARPAEGPRPPARRQSPPRAARRPDARAGPARRARVVAHAAGRCRARRLWALGPSPGRRWRPAAAGSAAAKSGPQGSLRPRKLIASRSICKVPTRDARSA